MGWMLNPVLSFMIVGCLKETNYSAWNWFFVYLKNQLLSMTIVSLKIFKTFKTHCCQQHWVNVSEKTKTFK